MEHLFNRSELYSESFRPVQTDVLWFTWSMKLRFADTDYHVANAPVVLMSWIFGVKSCTSWFQQHFELSGSNMFWKGVSRETLGTLPCHLATRDDAPEECRECRGTWSPTDNSKRRPGFQPRIPFFFFFSFFFRCFFSFRFFVFFSVFVLFFSVCPFFLVSFFFLFFFSLSLFLFSLVISKHKLGPRCKS